MLGSRLAEPNTVAPVSKGWESEHSIPFKLCVNLHLVDGKDTHPLEADAESCSPDSVTLARVQRAVQQLNSPILKGD